MELENPFRQLAQLDAVYLVYDLPSTQLASPLKVLPASLGYSAEECAELLSQPWPLKQLAHPDDLEVLRQFQLSLDGLPDGKANRACVRLRAKDGHWRLFSATVFVVSRDAQGGILSGAAVLKDFTAEHAREMELQYSKLSLELALDPCFRLGFDGIVYAANRAACALMGLTHDELIGSTLPYFDDAYAQDVVRRQETLRVARSASFESVLRTKDGNPIPLEVSANYLEVDGRDMIFATCRDLRPRQELQDRLLQVEKLETVSELVGGVAHDFNNLLAIVAAGLDQARPAQDNEGRWKAMDEALERGAALVRRMQAFARRRQVKTQPCDLLALIEACRPRLRGVLGAQMKLRVEGPADLPRALVDPSQLDEILLNLALNAKDATGGMGSLLIQVEMLPLGLDASKALALQPGSYLAIHALDDGPGVPGNIAARIFDPFFTTKAPGQGTGLGLASAYGIARQHGGRLELLPSESGAHFRVLLPQAPAPQSVQMPLAVEQAKGRLLLVDDETSLLDLLAPALAKRGYKVATANDAETALAWWDAQGPADILVTDLRMPGMDGRELSVRLREKRAGLPVLYISGWSPENPDAGLEPGTQLLAKPFRLAELYRALDQLQQG